MIKYLILCMCLILTGCNTVHYDYDNLTDETDRCLAKSCANQIKQILIPKYFVGNEVIGYRCERYRNDILDRFSLVISSMKRLSFYEYTKKKTATLKESGKEVIIPVTYKLTRDQIKSNILALLREDEELKKYDIEKISEILLNHFNLSQHYFYFIDNVQNEFKYY